LRESAGLENNFSAVSGGIPKPPFLGYLKDFSIFWDEEQIFKAFNEEERNTIVEIAKGFGAFDY